MHKFSNGGIHLGSTYILFQMKQVSYPKIQNIGWIITKFKWFKKEKRVIRIALRFYLVIVWKLNNLQKNDTWHLEMQAPIETW